MVGNVIVNLNQDTGMVTGPMSANGSAGTATHIEKVFGDSNVGTITGNCSEQVDLRGTGNNILYGGNGNDLLTGDAENDILWGGNDVIVLADGFPDYADRGNGGDTVQSSDASDTLLNM